MKKILVCAAVVIATTGIGYGLYRLVNKKRAVKTGNVMKTTAPTTPSVSEPTVETKKEVEMSTNRQFYYAAVKDLPDVTLGILDDTASFEDYVELATLPVTGYASRFYVDRFDVVGFVVRTRYGQVVVCHSLAEGNDTFHLKAPDRVMSLLPELQGINFKKYMVVGIVIENLLDEGG